MKRGVSQMCNDSWIGGTVNHEPPHPQLTLIFRLDDYIPDDSGITKAKSSFFFILIFK